MIQVFDRIISWPFNPWLTWIRPYGAVLNHSLLASLPHFLFGMTTGYIYQKIHLRSNGVHWFKAHGEYLFWAGLISILILLSTGWIDSIEISFCPYGIPLVPILLILIIIAAPMTRSALKIFESRGIRNLGIISYGIYLYHYPCLLYIEHYMRIRNLDVEIHWLIFGSISLAATVITATISYFAVERPFLRLVRGK
jgi:peptidoglycan/LPS O-acetylase OafA/YrhL